ncbi:MAG TPA: Ig-like domain-containing protein, partial [Longimicrobium sp.]|nr:Ig-like domain-containing protein [Longimicrobium sp.]
MKRITTAWRTTALVLFASVAAAACDGGTESRPPAAMTPNTPATQNSTAGVALAINPAVRVFDDQGTGVEGITVTFTVTSGGGSVTGATAVTNFDGVATVGSWKLGNTAAVNTLVATAEGLKPVTFTATGLAGAASSMRVISGDAQSGPAGAALTAPFVVRVSDQFDNPVTGAVVTFAVATGGGTVSPLTATTNAQGLASTTLTLGRTAGPNTVTATTPGAAPVTFTATARVGAAALITKVAASDAQTAQVNSAVPVAPTVTVTDAAGNPVPGVVVTFTVASGGGRVANTTATTGTTGTASSGTWTLGPTVGANTLTATAAGVTGSVTFTATATPPAVDPCTLNSPFTPRGTGTGTLAAGDCLLGTGQLVDYFSTTLAAASAEEFVLTSTAFDAFA